MCNSWHHRHSVYCILPPHILDSIARHGNPEQRDAALATRSNDFTFRMLRATLTGRRPQAPSMAMAMIAGGDKIRTIFDARGNETLPGVPVRGEGDPATGDPAVDEAYDGLGATYDFFWDAYGRNSIDDDGLRLNATVHFGFRYDNAFWDGERMVFGDGDSEIFNRFTIALDIIGHELAHGVTEDEAQLMYLYQAGALNESMSDVFGSLVKQKLMNETVTQADWLIGAGLLAPGVQGVALRSMAQPGSAYDDPLLGRDPQPAHMRDFVRTNQDNGGVHINSGIPNKAFHTLAMALGGFAWEQAGRIWYDALRDSRLRPNSGFRRFAQITRSVAQRLYGAGSTEEDAVKDAWGSVGIRA